MQSWWPPHFAENWWLSAASEAATVNDYPDLVTNQR
jgi:hypothetical protein